MHLYYTNVNDAFTNICRGFNTGEFLTDLPYQYESSDRGGLEQITYSPPLSREPSRYGLVIRIQEPVTITYTEPLQRVLFHPIRDANPFFHLIEALWMLSGQNSIKPLVHFNRRMGEFSDDDLTQDDIPYRGKYKTYGDQSNGLMWGAYGYRWRNWFEKDQLRNCIQALRHDATTRRVVLDMWCPADLQRVIDDPICKDVPCNLVVIFSPRSSTDTNHLHVGQSPSPKEQATLKMSYNQKEMIPNTCPDADDGMQGCRLLDMTVINRSNDTIWGALGANYVHFSFLQEYIANAAGMGVGHYHQISNNLHVYSNQTLSSEKTPEKWNGQWAPDELCSFSANNYQQRSYRHYPLYRCPFNDFDTTDTQRQSFDNACLTLFNKLEFIVDPCNRSLPTIHPYFVDVVNPLLKAWQMHKQKEYDTAYFHCSQIVPTDWRVACEQWLRRRAAKYTKGLEGASV